MKKKTAALIFESPYFQPYGILLSGPTSVRSYYIQNTIFRHVILF
jgi:hypothetical protein